MTSPLCCIGNTTTTCWIIDIVTGIVYFLPCNGINTAKVIFHIIIRRKIPTTTSTWISIIPIIATTSCIGNSISIITITRAIIAIPLISVFTRFQCQVVTCIFPSLTTEGNVETTGFLVIFSYFITIFIIICVFIFTVEEGEAKGCTFAIDPRFQVRNLVVFVFFLTTDFPVNFEFITSTAEVIFTKFNDTHQTIRFGVTCT